MFDTVHYKCPGCGRMIEEQTKAGDCRMNNYHEGSVPAEIAASEIGSKVDCGCGCTLRVHSSAPVARVKLYLVVDGPEVTESDEVEWD